MNVLKTHEQDINMNIFSAEDWVMEHGWKIGVMT